MKEPIVYERPGGAWQLENATRRAVILADEMAIEPTGLPHFNFTASRAHPAGVWHPTPCTLEGTGGETTLVAISDLRLLAGMPAELLGTSGENHLLTFRGGEGEARST
jgi:hypothetical protein